MKRRLLLIFIAILLFAGVIPTAGVFADTDHPIILSIQTEEEPELETAGTIPDLLFTIRNTGDTDYTLEHAELSGGFEDRILKLDEEITVLAGGTKEFHLTDVEITDEQLDTEVTYRLKWKETEYREDEESGASIPIVYDRETEAKFTVARFIPPELTVTASSSAARVHAGENFTVTYTIINDTKYDMSGLRLYDPEQSMQSIGLKSTDLFAGESMRVEVTYPMGTKDMTFAPVIEYTVRQREQSTKIETPLIVESVVVDIVIEVEQYPPTSEGSTFAITIRNAGNRTVTHIQLFDEINTKIDEPFDLAPDQSKVLLYTVPSAISSDKIRQIRFHLTAVDCLETVFAVTDPNTYDAVPYVDTDSVHLALYVTLQRAYYDENGKLCASIQCEIRNFSTVTLRNAKLTELQFFGDLTTYRELQNGETYFVTSLQLDGISELSFRVIANDPAGQVCSTDTVRLDLSGLKELADQKDEPVYVYPNNPYFRDLGAKYSNVIRIVGIALLLVASVCAIVCVVLYLVERKIKAKLPPEFEENMENAMNKTKRQLEPQIFHDAPTEQFGYTVPIKLRNYGELTDQEADARKREYQEKLKENLKEYSASPVAIRRSRLPEETSPSDASFSGTRIIPITRPPIDTLARSDVRIIPVEPEEPKPTAAKQETQAVPRVRERQKEVPTPVENKRQSDSKPRKKPSKPVEQPDVIPAESDNTPVQEQIPTAPIPDSSPVSAEAVEIHAPLLLKAMEQPAKRPIRVTLIKRMNG